ncbi:hypothetical protein LDENG_00192910 [Lucifuga dentata]|nr:hypothetical protein LDENG_00192910 [Lucifuga dentata]
MLRYISRIHIVIGGAFFLFLLGVFYVNSGYSISFTRYFPPCEANPQPMLEDLPNNNMINDSWRIGVLKMQTG